MFNVSESGQVQTMRMSGEKGIALKVQHAFELRLYQSAQAIALIMLQLLWHANLSNRFELKSADGVALKWNLKCSGLGIDASLSNFYDARRMITASSAPTHIHSLDIFVGRCESKGLSQLHLS